MLSPVNPDIRLAETLPGSVYCDPEIFAWQREHLFARTWLYLDFQVQAGHNLYPLTLLPGYLNESIVLSQHENSVQAFSNVCTHRGAILLEQACQSRTIRCPYHGRSFDLNGRFLAMPCFEQAQNFPRGEDHLSQLEFAQHGPFHFVSLNPKLSFKDWFQAFGIFDWVPWQDFEFAPELSRDYPLAANWMLYVDNYLEGLHIPYIHPALNQALDFKAYQTQLFDQGVLQVGYAAAGEDCFDLPTDHPDAGQHIAAYFLWVFPNLMFNLYPWGLSLNVIEPISLEETRVRYFTWIWDRSRLNIGAGADTDQTEKEDHQVILRVQQGVKSRLYRTGRYSPTMEQGVHHFHRLLSS